MWVALFVIALLVVLACWHGPARPPAVGGVSSLERVEIGGIGQWISIRAADPGAPVLLFLHGGPGSANIAKLRQQVPELEQHFVVVNWDQAGAGRSIPIGFDYGNLSIDGMVLDAHDLVTYLKARFGVEKIYLMGFSWGTVLGLELVARYPDDFYAYIGVSQVVSPLEGERISLEYVRRVARETGNERALADLAGIDPASWREDGYPEIGTERNWLLRFGGVYHTTDNYNHEAWMLLRAPEYSLYDVGPWLLGSRRSLRQLWPEMMDIDFFSTIRELHVPVYFFAGRYDYNVPSQLAERYYQGLVDPAGKHLVWFENSAHDIFFDEPDRLAAEMLAILEAQP